MGVEAAYFLNKLGNNTTLITFKKNDIFFLSCNVFIGGLAKGIVVKELFALGVIIPLAADSTQLQTLSFEYFEKSFCSSLRAQVDKIKYPLWMKKYIENSDINIIEGEVISLEMNSNKITGVILSDKRIIKADAVIIATGTFLCSKTMKGKEIIVGEPDGKALTKGISEQLEYLGIEL